jgi:hypothetical protein
MTWEGQDGIVGDVQDDQCSEVPRRESFIRHSIRPTMEEAAHLAAILILQVFGSAHFS